MERYSPETASLLPWSSTPPASACSNNRRGDTGVIKANEQPKKILVVNDTQEILDLFRDIFEEEGYEVFLYSFAFNDLVEIKRVCPDLIILDYMIGGEDYGWQVLQKLKMDRATANIPVIICTGALRQVRELEGHLKEKGVGIVLKPFDIDDLLHEVNECWGHLVLDAQHA